MLQLSNNLFPKALPFFFNTTSCAPAIGAKIHDTCLTSTKKRSPKYLRLPYVIFNDIDSIVPVGTDKKSSIFGNAGWGLGGRLFDYNFAPSTF